MKLCCSSFRNIGPATWALTLRRQARSWLVGSCPSRSISPAISSTSFGPSAKALLHQAAGLAAQRSRDLAQRQFRVALHGPEHPGAALDLGGLRRGGWVRCQQHGAVR